MTTLRLLLAVQVLAFWPVWIWYARRIADGGAEPWGLLAAAAACVLALRERGAGDVPARRLVAPTALVGAYAVTFPFLPPLLRAGWAALALVATFHAARPERPCAAFYGLALLALPDVSTLQYFVGYPFRLAVGAVAAPVLRALGRDVAQEGLALRSGETSVWIDAPCSGVWMLWAALLLTLVFACAQRHDVRATLRGVGWCVAVVFAGNALRTVASFLLETGAVRWPAWSHEAAGLVVFAAMAAAIATASRRRWSFARRLA